MAGHTDGHNSTACKSERLDMNPDRLALLRRWTDEQKAVACKAVFSDSDDNGFSVLSAISSTPGLLGSGAHDYDDPVAVPLDPASIRIDGLSRVGGVDISFRNDGNEGESQDAVAVLAVLDFPSFEVIATFIDRIMLDQPYIPEYLSMRELLPLTTLLDRAFASLPPPDRPQVLFVDGNGRLHERQAGLATALGVARDIPTVGVGKEYHPLRPDIQEFSKLDPQPLPAPPWPPISHFRNSQRGFRTVSRRELDRRGDWIGLPFGPGGDLVGAALAASPTTPKRAKTAEEGSKGALGKPIYVSSGHRVSLATAMALVLASCAESRVPEPVRVADRVGRDEAKRLWPT